MTGSIAIVILALIAITGAVIALFDLARRDYEQWMKIAWVAIVLAFPFVGLTAYAIVAHSAHVLVTWRHSSTVIVVVALAYLLCAHVGNIIPPFAIAFFIAALLDRPVTRLQARGISRARAVASIYVFVFLTIVLLGWLIIPGAIDQMRELSNNVNDYSVKLSQAADRWYESNRTRLSSVGLKGKPSEWLYSRSGLLADAANQIFSGLKSSIAGFAGQLVWLIIIPLSLFYFLLDFHSIRARLIAFVPEPHRSHVDRMSREVVEVFSDYIRSLAIVCALFGVVSIVVFTLLGLHYSMFLGVAAGALYAVPYAGPALTIAAALIIAVTMGKGAAFLIVIAVVYMIMQCSFDYGVTPRVVGGSVGLHPVVNIFALMAGASIFGVWGMLLAVPVAASVQKVLLYMYPRLGDKPAGATPPVGALAPGDEAQANNATGD